MPGCSAVGDPELVSFKARIVRQERPRHPMAVGLEPDVVSEAKVHDRIGDLARCRVGHHPFNPPEPIAVGGVYGRSLGMVAGDQPAVSTAIAGCCGSKALLGAHSMLLRQAEVDHSLFRACRPVHLRLTLARGNRWLANRTRIWPFGFFIVKNCRATGYSA